MRRRTLYLSTVTLIVLTAGGCGADEEACRNRTELGKSRVEAVRQANLQCFDASDCTLIDVSTDCQGTCPDVVNFGGVGAIEAEIAAVNKGVCAENQDAGCGYATPGCTQPAVLCDAGSCALQQP